jgi:NAD(P)-dependent dehydrogenase (short-subunit alcohol dehydrogenase family)
MQLVPLRIGDNGLGGWYSYRASKTALNQLTKNMSIEFSRKRHPVSFILLHPGRLGTFHSRYFAVTTPFDDSLYGPCNQSDTSGGHKPAVKTPSKHHLMTACMVHVTNLTHPGVSAALRAGTVDTDLSAPFQRNVPEGKLFTVERAAAQLLGLIGAKGQEDTGKFLAWDGQEIEW